MAILTKEAGRNSLPRSAIAQLHPSAEESAQRPTDLELEPTRVAQ
jgi:hypothetical protein